MSLFVVKADNEFCCLSARSLVFYDSNIKINVFIKYNKTHRDVSGLHRCEEITAANAHTATTCLMQRETDSSADTSSLYVCTNINCINYLLIIWLYSQWFSSGVTQLCVVFQGTQCLQWWHVICLWFLLWERCKAFWTPDLRLLKLG